MSSRDFIAVAGLPGGGKTTWINKFLAKQTRPIYYLCPGLGNISVDPARISYQFPWVRVVEDNEAQEVLTNLPDDAIVYFEIGFHLDLASPFLSAFPCHRVAVLPPTLKDSQWHQWADEVIPGNEIPVADETKLPQLWRTPLTGQVFDPPSLDLVWTEIIGGAYGQVARSKGIFEMPDGGAFHVDFVAGLEGSEYQELKVTPWLEGRPNRFSGIEIIGENLDQNAIAQTLLDCCLPDSVIAQYQNHYKNLDATQEAVLT